MKTRPIWALLLSLVQNKSIARELGNINTSYDPYPECKPNTCFKGKSCTFSSQNIRCIKDNKNSFTTASFYDNNLRDCSLAPLKENESCEDFKNEQILTKYEGRLTHIPSYTIISVDDKDNPCLTLKICN